jgi:outer membrane lipoprotein-sorting protein
MFSQKYKKIMKKIIFFILLFSFTIINAQDASIIVKKANDNLLGKTSRGKMTMKIIRPDWSREISMKFWSKGKDFYIIYVTAPARDKGQVFLKRYNEIWNYMPSINRIIKIPPSMMSQSWMGSDFKNNDLMEQNSLVKDYTHKIIGNENIENYDCYKIRLTPKPDSPVVWGKVVLWISKKGYMILKAEYYDEDYTLLYTQTTGDIRKVSGRLLPMSMRMINHQDEGYETVMKYSEITFDIPIGKSFFSKQKMKHLR